MTKNKKMLLVAIALVVLAMSNMACSDTDIEKIADDVCNAADNSDLGESLNDAVDDAVDSVNDAAGDVVNGKVPEINLPEVNAKENGEAVLNALEAVGDAVLDADTAAKELQSCFETCDGNYPDIAGSKVAANIVCVAECKAQ